ncbi:uncharacterized protein Bfra_007642 [Botrytis fragariae]|uniref:Uncharacterized protein n=1 Tax=Botrytis fragariae TaxID=1964551 RepID=A0A8H6APJ7_9HELO|nr:uncharacterized protein Bfra_007642 [Botrytis fragariae]KAF5871129.1 hypothetical protein Bfra_007642 [Botrytis fragariae]
MSQPTMVISNNDLRLRCWQQLLPRSNTSTSRFTHIRITIRIFPHQQPPGLAGKIQPSSCKVLHYYNDFQLRQY